MADDKNEIGEAHEDLINLNDDQIGAWSEKIGVSRIELPAAVDKVGPRVGCRQKHEARSITISFVVGSPVKYRTKNNNSWFEGTYAGEKYGLRMVRSLVGKVYLCDHEDVWADKASSYEAATRCEPPEQLKDEPFHWVLFDRDGEQDRVEPMKWDRSRGWQTFGRGSDGWVSPRNMGDCGWSWLAVAHPGNRPPLTDEALDSFLDGVWHKVTDPRERQRQALRAALIHLTSGAPHIHPATPSPEISRPRCFLKEAPGVRSLTKARYRHLSRTGGIRTRTLTDG